MTLDVDGLLSPICDEFPGGDPLAYSRGLRQTVESRSPNPRELLHHSDRGCQYSSDDYQSTLRTLGITCSMSRTGCCYDNAVNGAIFLVAEARMDKIRIVRRSSGCEAEVFRYIETFYNTQRIHQSLDYLTPVQFEAEHEINLAV